MHAHAYDAWSISPRLAFVSPAPECGKTSYIGSLNALVPDPVLASNAKPAVVFRLISEQRVTLLLDEFDA